jgi:membrane protease YdiL (CAAX protease family)
MTHEAVPKVGSRFAWLKTRSEMVVPVLGLLVFRAMLDWQDLQPTAGQTILVYGLAILYAALILWFPASLPAKTPRPVTRRQLKQLLVRVIFLVVAGLAALTLLSLTAGDSSGEGKLGLGGAVVVILLLIGLGTAGLAAERKLPVDLLPVLRRWEMYRIIYVLAASLFLALLVQLWSGVFSDVVAANIGGAFGETVPAETEAASQFDAGNPLRLFLNFLIGAGLAEEFLFRVGIMTPVWALTRRWWVGWLVSAVVFGLYHISPLSGMAAVNLEAPVTAVVESLGAGLAMGIIYRYRGLETAVMTHALGNWLVVMILLG